MNKELLSQIKELRHDKNNFQSIKKIIGEDRLKEFFNLIYPKFTTIKIEKITGISVKTLGNGSIRKYHVEVFNKGINLKNMLSIYGGK